MFDGAEIVFRRMKMKCIVLIIGFVMLLLSAWCILGNISLAIISFVNKKNADLLCHCWVAQQAL